MTIPINDFVTRLQAFPPSAFDRTEEIRAFLQESPVDQKPGALSDLEPAALYPQPDRQDHAL